MVNTAQEANLQGMPFGDLIFSGPQDVPLRASTGSCLQFSNAGSWADVPADVSGLSSDAATVEVWINTSATPEAFNGQVVYLGQGGDGAAPRLSIDAESRIKLYWSSSGSGGSHASADTTPVVDGRWHHVAVVIDRGAITFYKDGQSTTEPSPVSMPAGQPAGSPCQIGAGFGDATGFVGQVFDLRVWNRARSGEQISGLMYAAVDGSLTQQLSGLRQQGLLMAAGFHSGAPHNLVNGGTGDLHGCTIVQSPLPQNVPTITFGSFASDVYGSWNVMTPATSTRMQGVIGDSKQWSSLIQDQMLLHGFYSSLATSGDDAWGDATDTTTGLPVKIAKWTDANGVTHSIQNRAALTSQGGSGLGGDPVPTGGGATAQIIANDRGEATLITQKIEKVTDWTGTATGGAFLIEKAVTKIMTWKLNKLKGTADDVRSLWRREIASDDQWDEALLDVAKMEKAIGIVEIFGKFATGVAVLAALVDGIFRLFHPTTMSVSMWNETDLDLEWSLGYLNDGSYWLNTDSSPNGNWRPYPKKNTVTDDTSPIFGPIQYETVAAVNLLFGNGKSDAVLADQDIDQCILIRPKGSTGDPYVLSLATPLTGANLMGMGTGTGDEEYFNTNNTLQSKLDLHYTYDIGGKSVDFHLVTDQLKGETTYAGFKGYNYNTLLYIKPTPSSETAG